MINLFIAYDNTEIIFARLASHLKLKFIANSNYFITEITHPNLNEINVNKAVNSRGNTDVFIFVGYSHGQKDKLLNSRTSISSFTNTSSTTHYNKSIFYTYSCLSGLHLADSLINDGSLVYFGYKGEVFFLNEPLFISANNNIVNSGLIQLLKGETFNNLAFESAKNEILDMYDQYIGNTDDFDHKRCWTRNQLLLIKKE